jgi:hypothetical protein
MKMNMITNLYVENVADEVDFFKGIGFTEIINVPMGDYITVVLAPVADGNARIQIFDIEFIRQNSPEVADSVPSVLFTVDEIEEIYEKIKPLAKMINPIVDTGSNLMFNFQSPNGIYFAVVKE